MSGPYQPEEFGDDSIGYAVGSFERTQRPEGKTGIASETPALTMDVGGFFARESRASPQIDREVMEVAKDCDGILTKGLVVYKLGISLETAEEVLERFVQHRVASKISAGPIAIYDFPDVRRYLNKLENQLIEIFIHSETEFSIASLVSATKAPMDALDESLLDLERRGIISRNGSKDTYMLRIARESTGDMRFSLG
jgi:hypothetical protein